MQSATESCVFLVKTYYKTNSYLEEKEAFHRKIPEKDPPKNRAHRKTLKNYQREGTILNINKERSGRGRTVRNEEKSKVVRLCVENNARNASCSVMDVDYVAALLTK